MSYFDDVQIGDEVECLLHGVGKVTNLLSSDTQYRIIVEFSQLEYPLKYDYNGVCYKYFSNNQILFYKGVQIILPARPKRKVKRVLEGWLNIVLNTFQTKNIRLGECRIYNSEIEALRGREAGVKYIGKPYYINQEYEEEIEVGRY